MRSDKTAFRSMLACAFLVLNAAADAAHPATEEAAFLAENQAAMATMMAAMDIPGSGDIDQDFVASMVPHHKGAIDMALAELRHGRNEQLRRIAQAIIVEQGQEIVALRAALVPPSPAPRPN